MDKKEIIKEILIKHSIDDFDIGAKVLLTNIETIANEIIQSIETEQEIEGKSITFNFCECKHETMTIEMSLTRCAQCNKIVNQ